MNKIAFYYSNLGKDTSNRVKCILLDTLGTAGLNPKTIQIVYL